RRREALQREMSTLFILRDVVQAGMKRRELRSDLDPTVVTNALWAEIHGVTALMTAGLLAETSAGHADDVRQPLLAGPPTSRAPLARAAAGPAALSATMATRPPSTASDWPFPFPAPGRPRAAGPDTVPPATAYRWPFHDLDPNTFAARAVPAPLLLDDFKARV